MLFDVLPVLAAYAFGIRPAFEVSSISIAKRQQAHCLRIFEESFILSLVKR
jgi:hypothetical protein